MPESTRKGPRQAAPSRLMLRFFDRKRRVDYFYASLVAALPIPLAFWFDVAHDLQVPDGRVYRGYLGAYHSLALVAILPGLLWFARWAMGRMAPVGDPWPPKELPPVIELLDTPRGRQEVYCELRRVLLSPRLAWGTLVVAVLIHVADMGGWMVAQYVREVPAEARDRDWATMFLGWDAIKEAGNPFAVDLANRVTKVGNLLFVLSVYAGQFAVVLIAFLFGFSIAAHNFFFLGRIYQRRRVPDGSEELYIHIDLADGDRCFGFRRANDAFNTQVLALALGGIAMLVSRFVHTVSWRDLGEHPELILPNVGQAIMTFGWFAGFLVVCSPTLVKLLPRLPIGGSSRASRSVTSYLREFMAPDRWPFGREPGRKEIGALSAHFASNSFWPTGNNRASQLFFFAIWAGLIVFLTPPTDNRLYLAVSLLVLGVLALLGKNLLFRLLDGSLAYVDPRLVELPEGGVPELRLPGKRLEAGVFISYRRADSAAYTGRLYDYLIDHFQRDRIFMDIDDIAAGEKFPDALDGALASSTAVIIMIGTRWLSIEGANGKRRLDDPDDWVRLEVATALERGIKVFPVLVGGAPMPSSADLPEDLASLSTHNACEISDKRWDYDAQRLMEALRAALAESRRNER